MSNLKLKDFSEKDDWEEMPLSEAVEINNYPSADKGEEYKTIGMSDIKEDQRRVESYEMKEYTYSRPRFKNKDTVFARITPCLENGKTAFVDILDEGETAVGSTEFIVMSGTEKTLPKFVYYLARTPKVRKFAIKQMTGTSGRQRVPTDAFDKLNVKIPPTEYQKEILSVLDTLDSKIETNNDIIEKSERFMNLLAKNSGETETLDELGGFENNTQDLNGEKTYLYSFNAYDKFAFPEIEDVENINSSKYKVQPDSILISKLNPRFNRVWIPPTEKQEQVCSTEFMVYMPNEAKHRFSIYSSLKSDDFVEYMKGHTTGTSGSHQRVKPEDILDYEVSIPEKEELKMINSMGKEIIKLKQENHLLRQRRDALLPKLMSGEIRVNN